MQRNCAFCLNFSIAQALHGLYKFSFKTYFKGGSRGQHSVFELHANSTVSFPASYSASSFDHFIEVKDSNGIRKRTVQVNVASVLEQLREQCSLKFSRQKSAKVDNSLNQWRGPSIDSEEVGSLGELSIEEENKINKNTYAVPKRFLPPDPREDARKKHKPNVTSLPTDFMSLRPEKLLAVNKSETVATSFIDKFATPYRAPRGLNETQCTVYLNPLLQLLRGASPQTVDALQNLSPNLHDFFRNKSNSLEGLAGELARCSSVELERRTLLTTWIALLQYFLYRPRDRKHFVTTVRQEVLGDEFTREENYLNVTLEPNSTLDESAVLSSFMTSTDMKEEITFMPFNLVVELLRTHAASSCGSGSREGEQATRIDMLQVARALNFDAHDWVVLGREFERKKYELTAVVMQREQRYCTLVLFDRRWFLCDGAKVERYRQEVTIDTRGEYVLLLYRQMERKSEKHSLKFYS